MISCERNEKEPRPTKQILPPAKQPKLVAISSSEAEESNESYSPGNVEWELPTQKEQANWDHTIYVKSIEEWAKPQLARLRCTVCKTTLDKDFSFLDRNDKKIRFTSKCNCGHNHITTLQSK